jgi:GT2 family glycosyltransferase
MSGLSVVVVSYNGAAVISSCLGALQRWHEKLEIIVVDNGSIDATTRIVQEQFPDVRLVVCGKNLGFAGGCRRGVEVSTGEYCLLLNQDAVISGPVWPLVTEIDRKTSMAVIGGKVVYPDGSVQHTIGREFTPLRLLLSWIVPRWMPLLGSICARVETNPAMYEKSCASVPWVSGAFLLCRRDTWEKLGGMSEEYFMYVEDVDFCWRARDSGHTIGFSPEVVAIHLERGGGGINEKVLGWTARGYATYLTRVHGRAVACTFKVALGWVFLIEGVLLNIWSWLASGGKRDRQAKGMLRVGRELLVGR